MIIQLPYIPYIYRVPWGTWSFSYYCVISDSYRTWLGALVAALRSGRRSRRQLREERKRWEER